MGLEKLIDLLLKPIEGIAQAVYDAAYLEEEVIEKGKDGKETIRKVYSSKPSELQHYLDLLRVDYKTSKDMAYDLTVRPVDKYAKAGYEKLKKTDIFKPFVDLYKAHPVLTTAGCLLALCYI